MWKHELIKNKVCSPTLILLGVMTVPIGPDVTAFIFLLMVGVPLFFVKENWIL